MGNTQKQLAALNADSIRELITLVNQKQIQKEDVLAFAPENNSYYLLYYESH